MYMGQCVSYWTYVCPGKYMIAMLRVCADTVQGSSIAHRGEVSYGPGRKNRAGDGSRAGYGTCHRPVVRPGRALLAADIDGQTAQETSAAIEAAGGRNLPIQADVGELASIARMVQRISWRRSDGWTSS